MKTTLLTTLVLLTSTTCADIHSSLTLRHRESQGVGYSQGYSTLDYYLTSQYDKLEVLLNLRGHLFNNARPAANGGIAFRYSLKEDTSRIGANLYYDVRDTTHFVAQQVAGGLEWISNNVDVRMNGYIPVGKLHHSRHRFQGFTGNQVLTRKKFTGALPCLEGEVGTPLATPFYFAAGTYYLFQEKDHSMHVGNAWGWKARFDVDMGDYFTVGALVTHDRIFKTCVQGYLALNIPLGPWKSMKDGSKDFERRRIIRNEIIPIRSRKKSRSPLSSSDDDGVGMTRFLFVNNKADVHGDGTFEHPFSSLKEAEALSKTGDVIYVFPGDGTPHLMDEGIVLKESQLLASSGSSLEIDHLEIPALTPGQNPSITNIHPNEPVITNPGKTEVSNFFYMNPWEYLRMYDAPSYTFDSPSTSTPPDTSSPYNDPSLQDWVVVADQTPSPSSSSEGGLSESFVIVDPQTPTASDSPPAPSSGGIFSDYLGLGRKE